MGINNIQTLSINFHLMEIDNIQGLSIYSHLSPFIPIEIH